MTDNPTQEIQQTAPTLSTVTGSLTLRGALSMAIAFGVARLGVQLPDAATQAIAEAVTQLVFYAGLIAVGVGRARARGPIA